MADFLKGVGIVGWLIGGWLLYVGLSIETAVGVGEQAVANLQAMHFQQLNMLLGAFAILDGTVAFVGGAIIDALHPVTPPSD